MGATVTVRLDDRQQKALTDAARREGKSISTIVREALDRMLTERPISARAGQVKGRLRLSRSRRSSWKDALRARNWRP
jgi:predicted transcriptional regulator